MIRRTLCGYIYNALFRRGRSKSTKPKIDFAAYVSPDKFKKSSRRQSSMVKSNGGLRGSKATRRRY